MHKRIEPKFTITPLVPVPCWRKCGDYLTKQTGTAWLLFGLMPVWRTWDKNK